MKKGVGIISVLIIMMVVLSGIVYYNLNLKEEESDNSEENGQQLKKFKILNNWKIFFNF